MAEKSVKTRVQMKRGTQADWDVATAAGFKPLEGEYIFYTDLNKVKVGKKDAAGTLMSLNDLDFLDARDADTLDGKHASEFVLKTEAAPADAEKNVQSDWNVTDTSSDAFIKNKPTIPTALPANGGNADTVDNKHADDFVQSVKIGSTEYKSGTTVTLPAYPTTLKNPNALTIGGKSYDGSSAVSVTASDLGIANALHFIGETTTALTDGTTTAAVTIGGIAKTPITGDVVLYGAKEFVWTGAAWKELGDGSSHALKTITITAGNGLTGGGDISTNRTLNVGAGNGITVTADAVAAKAGNGITVDATGINHADTSSQASVAASGRTYVTGVTLDTYGHVTGLTTGTETVTDTHNSHAVISGKKADGSTDIKGTASSGDITLGDSGVTAGEYGPTANATPDYGATFNVPDIKVNSKGIVTSVVNRTVKIPASDNTDTKVTSVDNHYAPKADSTKELSVDANSTVSATWGSTDLVTGVNIQRDAKGHVTGVTVDSIQMPANPDTGATSVEVTGSGNVVTAASYNASTRKLTLTKGVTSVTTDTVKTEVGTQINTLISSGTADPSASTVSQYYFKYN